MVYKLAAYEFTPRIGFTLLLPWFISLSVHAQLRSCFTLSVKKWWPSELRPSISGRLLALNSCSANHRELLSLPWIVILFADRKQWRSLSIQVGNTPYPISSYENWQTVNNWKVKTKFCIFLDGNKYCAEYDTGEKENLKRSALFIAKRIIVSNSIFQREKIYQENPVRIIIQA